MKRDDPLVGGGIFLLAFGFIAVVPPLLEREYILTAWLGSMEQPIGIMALIVGGILFGAGKLRQLRNAAPVVSPTDPALLAPAADTAPGPADPYTRPSDAVPDQPAAWPPAPPTA
jgi:hypothetical protein